LSAPARRHRRPGAGRPLLRGRARRAAHLAGPGGGQRPGAGPARGPRAPFYLTGQAGGQPFSLHAEGERVILTGAEGVRQEIDLAPPAAAAPERELPEPVCPAGVVEGADTSEEPPAPGESNLDEALRHATG